ncbi:MAG TPA: TIGR03364 family FAD-dependent oxidoreductase, partial [Cyanothece sp. UBA12306]|nr:TIGR03364 family FAD-dependent oxidoreductase [Cyanothece sp. UBA12306]
MTQNNKADVLIIGAGIVGLSQALAYAKRGLKVVVFERNLQAMGASIRNFGMVWPIGQPEGKLYNRALKSRKIWLDIAQKANLGASQSGSLHLAYYQDELAVIEEFISTRKNIDNSLQLLTPKEVKDKSNGVNFDGLLGALWSSTEVIVDPREAIQKIPQFLQENYQVDFHFNTVVTNISYPQLIAGR